MRSTNQACTTATSARLCLVGLLIAIALFHALTVRQGHIWGDDFAMYVSHARNIVEGRPYAQTGYLFNAACPVSPRMYPPVFPLLLTPLVKLFGLNLMPMKLEQVFLFVLALAAVYLLWQEDLGPKYALAVVAILGFSPHFWAAKDNVLSDLPFMLFFYIATVLVLGAPRDGRSWWRWAISIGVVLYLAIGTRMAGVALIAGLLLYDGFKRRRITRLTVVSLSTCAVLLLVQSRFIGLGFNSYDGHFHATLHTVANHIISYPRTLAGFWVASRHNLYSFFLLAVLAVLTAIGAVFRYKQGLTIVEAFLVPYFGLAVLWPFSPGIRIVFPLLPWIVFLAILGFRTLAEKLVPKHTTTALCGFLLLVAVPYVDAYRQVDFGPIEQRNGSPEFSQLCQAVRDQTADDDVVIYFRARALALYTRRAASAYNYLGTRDELWAYARKIHATHLVITDAFDEDHGFLARIVEKDSSKLQLIYRNAHFALYRITTDSPAIAKR